MNNKRRTILDPTGSVAVYDVPDDQHTGTKQLDNGWAIRAARAFWYAFLFCLTAIMVTVTIRVIILMLGGLW